MKLPPTCEGQPRRDEDPSEADYRSLREVFCPMATRTRTDTTAWMKALAAPTVTALITGGIMYATVRAELSAVMAQQEIVLVELRAIKSDNSSMSREVRDELAGLRERVAALETKVK